MRPRIDTLYIYLQKDRHIMLGEFKTLDVRRNQHDFRFLRGNVPDVADNVYRYAKTFEINDIKRTFVLVTLSSNTKKVGTFFDNAKKQIEEDPALFKMFGLATEKPVETSITYGN